LRLAYVFGDCIAAPEDKRVDLVSYTRRGKGHAVRLYSVRSQNVLVLNTGRSALTVDLNGQTARVSAGGEATVRLRRRVAPDRACVFAPDFLTEPPVEWQEAGLPY
jgi:hypothetical protein